MNSYFIRHTNVLAVGPTVISRLYAEDTIAIHFPGDGPFDSRSLEPSDYKNRSERTAIALFKELATNGGYVWAQYYTEENVKIGCVLPGSLIVLREEKWTNPEYQLRLGSPAILKTLKMSSLQVIKPDRLQALRAMRPKQGTISRWPSAHAQLKAVIEHENVPLEWSNLSPAQQEIAFTEFLREHDIAELPKLQLLLMPPGRTLKDIDVYGLATDGHKIFAQVTYSNLSAARGKIERLRKYAGSSNYLVLLCRTDHLHHDGDVIVVPVSTLEPWLQRRHDVLKFFLEEMISNTETT